MKRASALAVFAGAIVAGALLANAVFVLGSDQWAVIERLGTPARVLDGARQSGAHLIVPLVERAVRVDRRPRWLEREDVAASDAEGRLFQAGVLARWRIVEPLAFLRQGGADRLGGRLDDIVEGAVRQAIGEQLGAPKLDERALAIAQAQARAERLGIALESLRITDLQPGPSASRAIAARMAKGFAGEAARIRAVGRSQARLIAAKSAIAAGQAEARGELAAAAIDADRQAGVGRIEAASYAKDPAFARFWRTLDADRAVLADGSATFVLAPDSPLLAALAHPPQAARAAAR